MKNQARLFSLVLTAATLVPFAAAQSQTSGDLRFEFNPPELFMAIGDTVDLSVTLLDADGVTIEESFLLYSQPRKAVELTSRSSDGGGTVATRVIAHRPGDYEVTARTLAGRGDRITQSMAVRIAYPDLARIVIIDPPRWMYAGTTTLISTQVQDAADLIREGISVRLTSSNTDVLSVDPFGNVAARSPGTVTITAEAEGLQNEHEIEVRANPVASMALESSALTARTGDVLRFRAIPRDANGAVISDASVDFSLRATPDDHFGAPASGQIESDGRFVAETPGLYTITARFGVVSEQLTVRVEPRNVAVNVEVLGHAPVLDVYTSDLWIWEGLDGRDYAITGTWSANGEAYFWDVTDPTNMQKIDVVTVDARTVNDVKVSEDGRTCVISREGASSRRNGIVILDCSDPSNVQILAEYDDELTGGVHNVFIYNNHVFAVNNGRRYDIINIEDPSNPYRVGRFELDTPGHSIHDVWIEDGIAYSSNWSDGVQLVDVGRPSAPALVQTDEAPLAKIYSGLPAGSPSAPVHIAGYEYSSGWNHAAFPYKSSTGRFYVVAGDEAFPYERLNDDAPEIAAGWLHFVDFTDLSNPYEVARYQVPEAGSHNYWIEDDILYAGFYNGGLRIVDVSGELMGDLYRQGREMAWFRPTHPDGRIKNAPMVWGAQPHKGVVFVADHYNGLWAVRLVKP